MDAEEEGSLQQLCSALSHLERTAVTQQLRLPSNDLLDDRTLRPFSIGEEGHHGLRQRLDECGEAAEGLPRGYPPSRSREHCFDAPLAEAANDGCAGGATASTSDAPVAAAGVTGCATEPCPGVADEELPPNGVVEAAPSVHIGPLAEEQPLEHAAPAASERRDGDDDNGQAKRLRLMVQLADGQVAPFDFAAGDADVGQRIRDFVAKHHLRDMFEEPLRAKAETMARDGTPAEARVDVIDLL